MSKRNQTIIISPESVALRRLREKSSLSLRELSELMNYSKTRINQMEVGRENISERYIMKFLAATGFSWQEWNNELGMTDKFYEARQQCVEKINMLEPSKLELVLGLLSNL